MAPSKLISSQSQQQSQAMLFKEQQRKRKVELASPSKYPRKTALGELELVTNATTTTTMAASNLTAGVMTRRGLATRQSNAMLTTTATTNARGKEQKEHLQEQKKRKGETSPNKYAKRSALGNITNAIGKTIGVQLKDASKITKKLAVNQHGKPQIVQTKTTTAAAIVKAAEKQLPAEAANAAQAKSKQITRGKKEEDKSVAIATLAPAAASNENATKKATAANARRSVDGEKSDDSSLYVSALESFPEECSNKRQSRSSKEHEKKTTQATAQPVAAAAAAAATKHTSSSSSQPAPTSASILLRKLTEEKPTNRNPAPKSRELPTGVQWDFDLENWSDPHQVPQYAHEIFDYLKARECEFPISDYMENQVCLSRWMRSLLVDWMVAVQESFELNHETLYLAVKLVDLYLTKVVVGKETLQLLGAASLFIASKFDERIPPMIEDFLYICDGAYTHKELTRMEINVLKVMNFDLGIPLSYRFLRRYARCAKVSMPTLTLARYILEFSLMDYSLISLSDSKMAAAALYLALQMKDLGGWTPTLVHYTGYQLEDFKEVVLVLNEGLHKKQKDALSTVRNKYSHKIFFEVAKVPLKDQLEL